MAAAPRHILGISAFYHDAAAALVREGAIVAAAQEERFSRRKNDERFPRSAIAFCLRHAGIDPAQVDQVVFYDKPITKFARLLESYMAVAPAGWHTFIQVIPPWLSEKLNLRQTIRKEIPGLRPDCPILFTEHHQAHAASAFYPSPFRRAAILTVDGVGEWATTTVGRGRDRQIELIEEIRFPHSLGLLYSAFTAYCGFRVNSGEYKLMGLAPYGEPRFVQAIYDHLIDLKPDGSFWLNLEFFPFLRSLRMTNRQFDRLLGGPPRAPESPLEQRYADVARSIQTVAEDALLRMARRARAATGERYLALAGGVALNCVANGLIHRARIFDRIWIQPAAGDAGGALGAALAAWHLGRGEPDGPAQLDPAGARTPAGLEAAADLKPGDEMQAALLGPAYSDDEIETALRAHGAVFERLEEDALLDRVAALLQAEKVVGWVQGRMEFGPRALGSRSILGDARSARMQSVMNLKVKFRESFRPFAPAVLRERLEDYFELEADSPYMLLVAPVRPSLRKPIPPGVTGFDRLGSVRSDLPAVTHIDYSARIQTVAPDQNPLFYRLLKRFEAATGCGVLVNTSFNVRGEPIVCSPDDAYRCLVNTEMDYLAIGHFLLDRSAQPHRRLASTFDAQPD
ncbi:MAG: carbamoyltransferase [Verrucomicrobia bacterium]|nr:carbamoyltransferase [Verrucomicrobiota bacterium]